MYIYIYIYIYKFPWRKSSQIEPFSGYKNDINTLYIYIYVCVCVCVTVCVFVDDRKMKSVSVFNTSKKKGRINEKDVRIPVTCL